METKVCIKCEVEKDVNDFFRDRRLKDGRFGRCKECSKEWVACIEVKARRVEQASASLQRSKEILTDNYVVRQICHHNSLTPDDVRKYPELIKAKKVLMLTNRIIKNEKANKKYKKPTGNAY